MRLFLAPSENGHFGEPVPCMISPMHSRRVALPTNGLIRYSFSSKLGLNKEQRQQEKKPSTALQRLQRLGRISSEIEKERKETKDLVVGIEEVSTSLGVPYKVSSIANCRGICLCALICTEHFFTCVQSCNLLANFSSDGYVVPWLRHPGPCLI
jgi:hypothetical protein